VLASADAISDPAPMPPIDAGIASPWARLNKSCGSIRWSPVSVIG
jgi:hypothetical protein